MTNTTAIQKCDDYIFNDVYNAIKSAMELVPPPDVKGKTVLLKPNILSPKKPEAAVCTHPIVVGAAVKLFVERGAKRVLVGESPATANSTAAAKATGMYAQVVDNGGEWVDFSDQVTVSCPDGKLVKSFEFASPFAQADILVSLSKLKSHQLMSYTGAMKNLFGLIVGLKKAQTHYRFSDKHDFGTYLTDLNIAAKPAYAIMDAIVGMEGPGGPGNGDPVKLGFIATSDNILSLDWTCAQIVGYNPHKIINLEDALNRHIWLDNPEQIQTVGCTPEQVKPASFKIVKEASAATNLQKMLPGFINALATLVFTKTPRFNNKKCIHCGRCIQICPAHILTFENNISAAITPTLNTPKTVPDSASNPTTQKSPVIMQDRKKCLHCFCCHEICPVEAITLRRF